MHNAHKLKLFSLKNSKEFLYPKNHGGKYRGKYLTIAYCKNDNFLSPGENTAHFGFKVTRKVGKAHMRNLIRRRCKFALREQIKKMNSYQSSIFVIIAHNSANTANYEELTEDINKALTKSQAN